VKERVMAARRGVSRSGVHGVVGNESDMAERRHAVEWDILVDAEAHATVVFARSVRGVWPGTFGCRFGRPEAVRRD
jgi:hypothetical protein